MQKEWPAAGVAKSLGLSLANVYVTRHRISAAIKKEARRLERELEAAVKSSNSRSSDVGLFGGGKKVEVEKH